MRLLRPGEHGAPIWITLAVVFPAILVSAGALAYYGYLYTESLSLRMEDAFRDNASADAETLVAAVETRIDVMTRSVLEQIVVRDGEAEQNACGIDTTPYVDSYAVLRFDANGTMGIVCTGGIDSQGWGSVARGQSRPGSYLKSLDFRSVQPGNFRYLHQRFERQDSEYGAIDVLIAYMRKETDSQRTYFVATRIRPAQINEIVNAEIAALQGRPRLTVLDQNRRATAGDMLSDPVKKGDRFLFETTFGKTLYSWDLQMAPWDVEALHAQEAKQRVLGPVMVLLSLSTIAVGLIIVWFGVISERRASQLKSEFIANVSHELKTPLSLIRMFGEMIATGRHKGPGAVQEYGEIITRESERLSHLIDNVLDFARLERGRASYRFVLGDLSEVLERALDVCRFRLEKEKVRLVTRVESDLPAVRMDEDAITLVVLNLVDNAVKYGAEGGIVEVTLTRAPGQVVMRVRDHGPGIPGEERDKVFERFYRAQAVRNGNVRGSGIGLSLVRYIVAAHGGRVVVESPVEADGKAGRGVVFCVFLPAPVAEAATPAVAAGDAEGASVPAVEKT